MIDRAAGRTPRPEWSYYSPDIGAWLYADEPSARRHEHHQRIRVDGLPWCDVLGHRTDVADDLALQTYFMTIEPDGWPRLAIDVAQHPKRCLREWRAGGALIISAVDLDASASGGPLSDWPESRGTGPRSMLPR
ncbi:hypothetical protein [Rhodopseudomonas palustris]|uniref:hypothetical protein n=1 Tax=Rhodopseudomonas palustris TaxID=1076 RepID=UPI0021F3267A|nr:hypothetical protein [Rhodopseudomonas palustris]